MTTRALTRDDFEQTVSTNEIVLIDFWAEWCGPCKAFGPVYEEVSGEHADVVFAKVDTEDQQELAASFGIRSIPTVMAFRENVLVYAQPGALPKASLRELVEQLKALDMDEVRAEIAKHDDGHADHDHADHDHADHDHEHAGHDH